MNDTSQRPPGSPKKFECPNCGDSVSLLAHGHTVTVTCPACGSLLDVNNPRVALLQAYEGRKRGVHPAIPIGSAGELEGARWQVVGFLQKKSINYDYLWREYLLFNPYLGYRYLSEFKGHWTLFEVLTTFPLNRNPQRATARVDGDKRRFALYERTNASIAFVMGEFPWRVREGDKSAIQDFISPPYGLSEEREGNGKAVEINWSLGKYIEPEAIQQAFGLEKMPSRVGIGIHQPSPYQGLSKRVWLVGGLAFLLLTGKMMIDVGTEKHLMDQAIALNLDKNDAARTTSTLDAFTLDKPAKVTEIRLNPTLEYDNTEIEGEGALVNVTTGETFPAFVWAYYASGNDEDGAWTEHGNSDEMLFFNLPAGTYKLTYDFKTTKSITRGFRASLRFIAVENPVSMANYFIALLVILVTGVLLWVRERSVEKERWSESDYSPYASAEDDDD